MSRARCVAIGSLAGLAAACGDGTSTGPGIQNPAPAQTATYQVTVDATWSQGTHPIDFPPNPHFSGLIGGTHDPGFDLWRPGQLATTGIKDMAELGAQLPLRSEVEAAIQTGNAGSVISGAGINPSPGDVTLTFDIDMSYPYVSLVSMIAPSPDWFVGVDGLALFQNGAWLDTVTLGLLPYDAGTDSGTTYTSANALTTPSVAIIRITAPPFDQIQPIATVTFTRQ